MDHWFHLKRLFTHHSVPTFPRTVTDDVDVDDVEAVDAVMFRLNCSCISADGMAMMKSSMDSLLNRQPERTAG
jgi:hypothetical protein